MHVHPSSRQPIRLPHRAGIAPPRAGSFQQRDAARELAHAVHHAGAEGLISGAGTHTSVVSGLGGVGKTQLALNYAENRWAAGDVDALVWVTAGSREAIMSGYARLAAGLTGIDDPNPEQGAQRLVEWLSSAWHGGWWCWTGDQPEYVAFAR
jgi:hypothetical protein